MFSNSGNWTKTAIGLVVVMVILQAVNVVRVVADPIGFSQYMGIGIDQNGDTSFVYVYGLRTAFIIVIACVLLFLRDFRMLSVVAVAALILPIGDAMLALRADASFAIVVRHFLIGLYLAATALVLGRAIRETNS
ncbi:MAG: DUF4267 domain-containing protein [Pseudomonadota bacterium]